GDCRVQLGGHAVVAPGDLYVAVVGQLSAAHFPPGEKLEPRPMQIVERGRAASRTGSFGAAAHRGASSWWRAAGVDAKGVQSSPPLKKVEKYPAYPELTARNLRASGGLKVNALPLNSMGSVMPRTRSSYKNR